MQRYIANFFIMCKIINLQEYHHQNEYSENIAETKSFLLEMQDELYTKMINIASAGVWKEWMDSIPIGGEFNFTSDMIENTGDKKVELLWELYYKISDVLHRIELP